MFWIVEAKYIKEYKVWLRFNDGVEKTIDFKEKVFSETRKIFEPLKNVEYFKQVFLNPESDTIQ